MTDTTDFPPLPEPAMSVGIGSVYTAKQMHDYLLADRARRAAQLGPDSDLDGRLPDRLEFSNRVPENVMAALNRMCSPLHPSRLTGFTAEQDAKCMALIRSYVLGDDGMCKSCIGDKCVTGPECVTLGRDS